MMMRARIPRRMRCPPAPLDIIAALRADGLPDPALAGRLAYRCILAALGLALSVLLVSALFVSGLLVSALGSTAAGRSTYFGASAASALFDEPARGRRVLRPAHRAAAGRSAQDHHGLLPRQPTDRDEPALAGAGAACVSLPPNDKLRSPA